MATLVLFSVLVMLVAPQARANMPGTHESDGDDSMAVDLIYRSAEAPRRVSYAGTQYVSTWSSLDTTAASASAVMTVDHQARGTTRVAVPSQRAAILEWRDGTSWLAGSGGSAELLLSAYLVTVVGPGTVAGRPTVVVEARREDGTIAARLWLDAMTALTLRRETFDHGGVLLSASAFVSIELQVTVSADLKDTVEASPTASGAGMGVGTMSSRADSALDWSDIEALRDHGWLLPDELTPGMKLYEAHRYDDVIQLSYSDGVMAVSVFEQPGRLDYDSLDGYRTIDTAGGEVYAAPGPPARYMWSSGEQVVTVVSEAPASVLEEITTIMPPDTSRSSAVPDDGVLARIIRGAKKVSAFLNPFD